MPAGVQGLPSGQIVRWAPTLINLCQYFQPTVTPALGANPATVIFDTGTSTTYYMGSGTQTWTLDFRRPYRIERVDLYHADGSSRLQRNLGIYGSYDGTTWSTIRLAANTAVIVLGVVITNPANGVYRYVRITADGDNQFNSHDWSEWQVWGRLPQNEPLYSPPFGAQYYRTL